MKEKSIATAFVMLGCGCLGALVCAVAGMVGRRFRSLVFAVDAVMVLKASGTVAARGARGHDCGP
ncbi:hypothetical protein, partial [Achromobacter animicus]|uniref:hypothetical protein n=1 Tax=Achromobacter animicus TaxID=1389935 RepID=UPI0028AA44AB